MAFRLQVEDLGTNLLQEYQLDNNELVAGRADHCGIVIPSTSVSREHARFFTHLGQPWVEDLGSANGVVVDGVRIQGMAQLHPNAVVVLGDHIVRCVPVGASAAIGSSLALIRLDATPEGPRILPITKSSVEVGRGSAADVRINHRSVSRAHVEIRVDKDYLIIRDLGSANGTQLNGQLLTRPTAAAEGDILQVGDIALAVTSEPATFDWRNAVVPGAAVGAASGRSSGSQTVPAILAAMIALALIVVVFIWFTKQDPGTDPAPAPTEPTAAAEPDPQALAEDEAARALGECKDQYNRAAERSTGGDLLGTIEALTEVERCLGAISATTQAGREAKTFTDNRVTPRIVELNLDIAAQDLGREAWDEAIARLRNVRTANRERDGGPNAELGAQIDNQLREAFLRAGRAAYTVDEWRRARSMLEQARDIRALDEADAQRLTEATRKATAAP